MNQINCLFFVFILLGACVVKAANIAWIADNIAVSSFQQRNNFFLTVQANGIIYEETNGHFRVKMEMTNRYGLKYVAQTQCLSFGSPAAPITSALNKLNFYNANHTHGEDISAGPTFKVYSVFTVGVIRFFEGNDTTSKYKTAFEISFGNTRNASSHLNVTLNDAGCAAPRTIGQWSDVHRWSPHSVPGSGDNVVFSAGAGVVKLNGNTVVNSLTMRGGLLLNYDTYCPAGWSTEPNGLQG